ncbi:MAG: cell wall-binding repeat-containing protein [Herbiconiux sp.]|nr:cell wall-binding repeat-containing protein [Herbiconiux sp.]
MSSRTTRIRRRAVGLVVAFALALGAGLVAIAPAAAFTSTPIDPGENLVEFDLPNPSGQPSGIVAGADGSVWVSVFLDRQVIRLDRNGAVVATVNLSGGPASLSSDNRGGAWVALYASNAIAHISASGVPTEYPIPTPNTFPAHVYDSGGFVYFTESSTGALGRLTLSTGRIEEFPIPGAMTPWHLDGAAGQVWVADTGASVIWRLDGGGVILGKVETAASPLRLDLDSDGSGGIRGAYSDAEHVNRIAQPATGAVTSDEILEGKGLTGLARGAYRWWVADPVANTIGFATFVDVDLAYSLPTPASGPQDVTMTEGRYVWVVEKAAGKVARLDAALAVVSSRVSGKDRYETAAALAMRDYPTGVGDVFVASGEKFADALTAGPPAALRNAPLLLATRDELPEATRRFLSSKKPVRITVVGGPASVSEETMKEIRSAAPDAEVTRVDGPDRYAVSRSLLTGPLAPVGGRVLYVADGRNFPDALSSGPAAARYRAGILLVDGGAAALSPAEMAVVAKYTGPSYVVKIAGGPVSVNPALEAQMSTVASVQRIAGADRYAASLAINDDAFLLPDGSLWESTIAMLASGESFPDALAGGASAGADDTPLLLVRRDCVPPSTVDRIIVSGYTQNVVLGGPNTLGAGIDDLTPC